MIAEQVSSFLLFDLSSHQAIPRKYGKSSNAVIADLSASLCALRGDSPSALSLYPFPRSTRYAVLSKFCSQRDRP